uniref:Uncharacterized protein n=1 Tax=Arundo donax TaxID=35708 RepID=A0A0A8YLZ1_ARUDO
MNRAIAAIGKRRDLTDTKNFRSSILLPEYYKRIYS